MMPLKFTIPLFSLLLALGVAISFDILKHPPAIPPAVPEAPAAAPTTDAASAGQTDAVAKTPATKSDMILDLFQPSEGALAQQHSSSVIASQIENVMVICYTLVRCNIMSQQEYADTFNALITYSTNMKFEPDDTRSEARVRELSQSAAASYSMVYSNTNCADPELLNKAVALKTWRQGVE